MIVLRKNNQSKNDTITLFHVTKISNLPSIRREGLKTKYFKQREENKYLGIKETGLIYLVKDKNKLVKPHIPGKTAIISITLPLSVFEKMDKLFGDPEWHVAQKVKNWDETKAESLRKAYPEKFGKMSTEEIMKDSTPLEYGCPENCICLKEDIDPKYIKF